MSKLLHEIKVDLSFIKSHTLQPKWFKVLKVLILLGVCFGYYRLFGLAKTVAFFATFFFLMLLVHLVYRAKTNTWKQSWLDFVVVEENGEIKAKSIGKFYYAAVVLSALLALVLSQMLR
jgi:hypothetical protein